MSYESEYRKIKIGDKVKLRREMKTNGGTTFAAGKELIVVRKSGGLHLETFDLPCLSCGIVRNERIAKISPFDVLTEYDRADEKQI